MQAGDKVPGGISSVSRMYINSLLRTITNGTYKTVFSNIDVLVKQIRINYRVTRTKCHTFYHPIKIVTTQYRCCKRASQCCSSWKIRQMSVCKMADNGRLIVDQKVKIVLFYAETRSIVATQRRFRAQFGRRWALYKQTIYRLPLEKFFQPMRINSVPDVRCFCNN